MSIASTHNESPKDTSIDPLMMGFGICDATQSDECPESKEETVADEYGYNYSYCMSTNGGDHKYQSYHTKLKSLDDILIAFNTKSMKVTLWQNGKRFNKVFQLHPDRVYGFGIKLMCDEYCISILPDTGN